MVAKRHNQIPQLPRIDPEFVFKNLRLIDRAIETQRIPILQGQPLTHQERLKAREFEDASIFCYALSCRFERPFSILMHEDSDFDFVAEWHDQGETINSPVQLKRLVPNRLNQTTNIQEVINKLKKYKNASNLTVAIRINRTGTFQPAELEIPKLEIGSLWVFWSTTKDQSSWRLFGDMLSGPICTSFMAPA